MIGRDTVNIFLTSEETVPDMKDNTKDFTGVKNHTWFMRHRNHLSDQLWKAYAKYGERETRVYITENCDLRTTLTAMKTLDVLTPKAVDNLKKLTNDWTIGRLSADPVWSSEPYLFEIIFRMIPIEDIKENYEKWDIGKVSGRYEGILHAIVCGEMNRADATMQTYEKAEKRVVEKLADLLLLQDSWYSPLQRRANVISRSLWQYQYSSTPDKELERILKGEGSSCAHIIFKAISQHPNKEWVERVQHSAPRWVLSGDALVENATFTPISRDLIRYPLHSPDDFVQKMKRLGSNGGFVVVPWSSGTLLRLPDEDRMRTILEIAEKQPVCLETKSEEDASLVARLLSDARKNSTPGSSNVLLGLSSKTAVAEEVVKMLSKFGLYDSLWTAGVLYIAESLTVDEVTGMFETPSFLVSRALFRKNPDLDFTGREEMVLSPHAKKWLKKEKLSAYHVQARGVTERSILGKYLSETTRDFTHVGDWFTSQFLNLPDTGENSLNKRDLVLSMRQPSSFRPVFVGVSKENGAKIASALASLGSIPFSMSLWHAFIIPVMSENLRENMVTEATIRTFGKEAGDTVDTLRLLGVLDD